MTGPARKEDPRKAKPEDKKNGHNGKHVLAGGFSKGMNFFGAPALLEKLNGSRPTASEQEAPKPSGKQDGKEKPKKSCLGLGLACTVEEPMRVMW